MYMEQSFAVVSDGDVRFAIFSPAIERGSLVAWLWSSQNAPKELVALDLDSILSWPFDAFTDDGRAGTLPLTTLFPPANAVLEWIPRPGSGWCKLAESSFYLRVSPFLAPSFPQQEFSFVLYDASDNSVQFPSASALWRIASQLSFDSADLVEKMGQACAHFPALFEAIHHAR